MSVHKTSADSGSFKSTELRLFVYGNDQIHSEEVYHSGFEVIEGKLFVEGTHYNMAWWTRLA